MDKIELENEILTGLKATGIDSPKIAESIAATLRFYHPKMDREYLALRLRDLSDIILDIRADILCEQFNNE